MEDVMKKSGKALTTKWVDSMEVQDGGSQTCYPTETCERVD